MTDNVTSELLFRTLQAMQKDIADLRREMTERFDGIEARLDRTDERLSIMTIRIDEGYAELRIATRNASRLAQVVDTDNAALRVDFADLKDRVAALESRMAAVSN